MPNVTVFPKAQDPSHDISLSNGTETIGLIYADVSNLLQEIPISEPDRPFGVTQKSWFGGKGKLRYQDDPNGYFDSQSLWTMTDGKLFPVPQWRFAQGIRSCDSDLPGSLSWQALLGSQRFISRSFAASASYNADKIYIWLRRYGNPDEIYCRIYDDNAGNPGTLLVSKQISNIGVDADYAPPSQFVCFDFSGTQALVSGTTYHIRIHGSTSSNNSNYWEVGVNSAGTSSKISSNGTSWTTAAFSMYFRVTDADTNRQWFPFVLSGAQYICSKNDDETASKIFINGDRFKATSATATSATDTSSGVSAGWTADRWIGAWARIIKGVGNGQERAITDNDTTSITFASMDVTPTTTSEFVIYGTDWWTEVTGHGLGQVVSRPCSAGNNTYFPQGESVTLRRITLDYTAAIQHKFAADGTNKADFMNVYQTQAGSQLWKVRLLTSGAAKSTVVTTWVNSAYAVEKIIGSVDNNVTNLFVADELYAFKEDGLYRFESEIPKKVNTGLEASVDPSNGLAAASAPGALWIGWNHSIARMIGSDVSDQLNFKAGYNGVPIDRSGVVSSIVSALGWVFVAIDGGTSNTSSILVWNGFGWQELFRAWTTGVRIRNIFWQSNSGTRPRLWFDVGGDLAYIEFPMRSANPMLDTGLSFQHEAVLITGTYDGNDPNLYKLFHSTTLVTDNLGTFGKVYLDYQKNEEVGTTTWHYADELSTLTYKEFILDLGEVYSIRFRLRMQTNTATSPVVINSFGVDGWVSFPTKYQWVGNYRVGINEVTKNGLPDFDPDKIVDFITSAHEKKTKVRMRSLKSAMDDRVVILSAPVVITDNLTDEGWSGRIQVALREP